ncbi:MAG: peptidylprolyl isomerase [Bacteroidaceae bacterium]|nr:peptidylprolyl isomerase [Bacteroidaceae bacterium]
MKPNIFLLFLSIALSAGAKKLRPQVVRLETTMGTIRVELSDETPRHRDNFLKLAREGLLDSTLFHRVIRDFMIQGGDPNSRVHRQADGTLASPSHERPLGEGSIGTTLPAEIRLPWLYHVRGALAAAREPDEVNPEMRSSGSQFYIVYGKSWGENSLGKVRGMLDEQGIEMNRDMWNDYLQRGGAPHLDGAYTVFGRVVEGMKVLKAIQAVATDGADRPLEDVVLLRAVVE